MMPTTRSRLRLGLTLVATLALAIAVLASPQTPPAFTNQLADTIDNAFHWDDAAPPAKSVLRAVHRPTSFKPVPKPKPKPKPKSRSKPSPSSHALAAAPIPLRDLLLASLTHRPPVPLPKPNRLPRPASSSRPVGTTAGQPVVVPNPDAPTYTTRAAYHVPTLPDIALPADYALYAGHLPVDNQGSTEFFMYFERTAQPTDDLIVWLNGGPGASSLFGLFVENGPFQFNLRSGRIQHNPAGWHQAANILFVENPAGVGFSSVLSDNGYPKTIDDVGEQFWRFSQEFMKVFGKVADRKGAVGPFKWWIIGESFGGMYVPHIASHVVAHNDHLQYPQEQPIHLAGIAVGNGAYFAPVDIPVNWVDYFALRGLLRQPTLAAELQSFRNQCSHELADPDRFKRGDMPNCLALTQRFTNTSYVYALTEGKHCLSTFYDVRVTGCGLGDPTDPYNALTAQYLNRADVQVALHASGARGPRVWNWISLPVYQRLYWNGDRPSYTLLPGLAARGIPVLVYNGDADIICNHAGNELMLAQLAWRGQVGFGKGKRLAKYVPKGWWSAIGGHVSARGIGYVRIFEAGHMVPFNKPWESLAMVQDFLAGRLVAR